MEVTEIKSISDMDFVFPPDFSFFEPYLQYHVKEILEIGGETYVSRTSTGEISGLFIYDSSEKIGTIYTRLRDVFDYFFELKPFNSIFAELKTEQENEIYDIYTIELSDIAIDHRFSHEITIAQEEHIGELERLMALTYPGINRMWVRVALRNGDKCFFIKINDETAGWGWLSFVNGIGRFHTLYVRPQFRGMHMGEDLLYARLFWLKSKHARSAFSEISRFNSPCSRVAVKGHMRVYGQVFQYFKKDSMKDGKAENLKIEGLRIVGRP
jgi:hypothetical protein